MSAQEGEPGFEEFLRGVPGEPLDPRRCEEARRAFLGHASRAAGADRMRAVMGGDERFDEHDGFVAWLAACPPALPGAEFQRRARLAFLSAIASEATAALPLRRERRSVRAAVLALAAAAILAVTFLLPRPDRWEVRMQGPLRFAERDYAPGDGERLAADLERSGMLETAGSGVRFALGKELVVEVMSGSSLSFPPLPELDGLEPVAFELARGEAYVRTGGAYPGNPVIVRTAQADVVLNGTVVGVLVGEFGTCVCVAEGKVGVMSGQVPGGRQEVGGRTTMRVLGGAGGVEVEVFPEGDGDEHTKGLVEFGRGR